MTELKQELSFLMLGQQGGENRIKILELLKERSYNLNQLATKLDLNYRTIKYHIDIMLEYGMIESSGEGYGQVYFISPELEENYEILEDMKKKLKTVFKSPKLYEKVLEQTHEGIMILDENKDIIYLNKSVEDIIGYRKVDLLGKDIKYLLNKDLSQAFEIKFTEDGVIEKTINLKTQQGEKKKVDIILNYFYSDKEEHNGYSILMKDVTQEKNQKEILNAIMNHSEILLAYLDKDFDLVYVNSAYADKTDYSPEELIGMNHFKLFPNEENKKLFEGVLKNGESKVIRDRGLFNSDESEQNYNFWSIDPFNDIKGNLKGLVLSMC